MSIADIMKNKIINKNKLKLLMMILLMSYSSFVLLWIYGHSESYCVFYPSINTSYAPSYTEKKFDLIKKGMRKEDVLKLIGAPLEEEKMGESGAKLKYSRYVKRWIGRYKWLRRYVILEHEMVVGKEKAKSYYFD